MPSTSWAGIPPRRLAPSSGTRPLLLSQSRASRSRRTPTPLLPPVFPTARRDDKCEFAVANLGATAAVNMAQHPDKRSWAAAVKALNGGQGVDLVVDFLGGPYIESNLDVLAIDGSIVQLGWLGGPITEGSVNIGCIMTKRARVQGSQLRSRDLEYQVKVKEIFVE